MGDGEAEIAKLKDGRTALAYKAENAVDMETRAIVAVTTHAGAAADTATVEATVTEAGVAPADATITAAAACLLRWPTILPEARTSLK